ncbi:MAG TPA: hypothetical protein VK177_01655 [Flavobacteriales bacterium]|nr:hypothetical protein [Flavobacteriales bacterium]
MNTGVKHQKKWTIAAGIAQVIVILAMVRCIGECFRLNYTNEISPGFSELKPFLIGAMACGISVMVMLTLSFFNQRKSILAAAVLTIAVLVYIKSAYL